MANSVKYAQLPEWGFKVDVMQIHRSVVVTVNCRFPVWPRCLTSLFGNTPMGCNTLGRFEVPAPSRSLSSSLHLSPSFHIETTKNCQIFLIVTVLVAQGRMHGLSTRARSCAQACSGTRRHSGRPEIQKHEGTAICFLASWALRMTGSYFSARCTLSIRILSPTHSNRTCWWGLFKTP